MLWFTVWTLLVAGALVTFFLVGRDLWRKAKRLGAAADEAAQALGRLEELVAEAQESLPLTTPAPVSLDDPEPARARLALAAQATERRRAARAARHEAAYARWRALTR